jgi:FlaA1/EpsC-like NDP-sugar epimerase
VKKIIHQFAAAPRLPKQLFLVVLDALAFPVMLWLCYVIRLFDLGAQVIQGIHFGVVLLSLIAVFSLGLTGVYHFIVRTFNEVFILKFAIAVLLTMVYI